MATRRKKNLKRGRRRRKKKNLALKFGIGMAISIFFLAACLTVIFSLNSKKYQDHFLPGTVINGTDCADMTVEEAEAAILKHAAEFQLVVIPKTGESGVIRGSDIDYAYTSDGSVAKIMKEQDGDSWVHNRGKKEFAVSGVSYNKEKLRMVMDSFSFFTLMKKPENARVVYQDGGFMILPEKKGEMVGRDELYEKLIESVDLGVRELELEKSGLYMKPAITYDSEILEKQKQDMEKLISAKITYLLPGGRQKVLDGAILSGWLSVDADGNLYKDKAFFEEKLQEFIKELEYEVDSKGKAWTFYSTLRGPVTVSGGTYGWEISNSQERERLRKDLESNAVVEREPIYVQRGNDTLENGGIGNTYVEVDMNAQRMWYYEEGVLKLETDVVTGKMTKDRYTPEGVWQLFYKQKDRTLIGELDPKTNKPSYEQPVEYWMNFTSTKMGIGFHDLKNHYGNPKRYIRHGSHGCVNMPKDKAKELYAMIEIGTPVITFYPEGYELKD